MKNIGYEKSDKGYFYKKIKENNEIKKVRISEEEYLTKSKRIQKGGVPGDSNKDPITKFIYICDTCGYTGETSSYDTLSKIAALDNESYKGLMDFLQLPSSERVDELFMYVGEKSRVGQKWINFAKTYDRILRYIIFQIKELDKSKYYKFIIVFPNYNNEILFPNKHFYSLTITNRAHWNYRIEDIIAKCIYTCVDILEFEKENPLIELYQPKYSDKLAIDIKNKNDLFIYKKNNYKIENNPSLLNYKNELLSYMTFVSKLSSRGYYL